MLPSISLATVRLIVGGGVAFVLLALVGLVILLVIHGAPTTGPQIISLLGIIATLTALLANLLGVSGLAGSNQQLTDKLNGHLDAHARGGTIGPAGPIGPQGPVDPQGAPGPLSEPDTIGG